MIPRRIKLLRATRGHYGVSPTIGRFRRNRLYWYAYMNNIRMTTILQKAYMSPDTIQTWLIRTLGGGDLALTRVIRHMKYVLGFTIRADYTNYSDKTSTSYQSLVKQALCLSMTPKPVIVWITQFTSRALGRILWCEDDRKWHASIFRAWNAHEKRIRFVH